MHHHGLGCARSVAEGECPCNGFAIDTRYSVSSPERDKLVDCVVCKGSGKIEKLLSNFDGIFGSALPQHVLRHRLMTALMERDEAVAALLASRLSREESATQPALMILLQNYRAKHKECVDLTGHPEAIKSMAKDWRCDWCKQVDAISSPPSLSSAPPATESGWIDVKHKLPDDGEPVLIVWSGVVQHLTYARFEGCWYPYHEDPDDFQAMNEDINLVTLWQYLPSAPKGGS